MDFALRDRDVQFKFRWLNEQGQESGFLRKPGRFDGEVLTLDDAQIPVAAIAAVEVREQYLILSVMGEGDEPAVLACAIASGGAAELKRALDAARSAVWAELHREQLQKAGRGHAYRDDECPHCGATVVLSDMPRTPQLYCPFCETLTTPDAEHHVAAEERHLRLCPECSMFSKPRKFTVFYFYFLLVVYGWRTYPTWRCPACMRGDAWKMLFGNLIFVLGVPVAVVQLVRSYGGSVGGIFAGLDAANLKARNGNVLGALESYREILGRVPHSAGVKYNLGLALLQKQDLARAAETFRLALEDCANYAPAYQPLVHCYELLGETERLADLQKMWGDVTEDEPAVEEAV